jgi:biopolymer transport protein TolQ
MIHLYLASSLWTGLEKATVTGQVICLMLVLLSIASWVAMTRKFLDLRVAKQENRRFRAELMRSPHPMSLFGAGESFRFSPMYLAYFHGCKELAFYLLGDDKVEGDIEARFQAAGRITPGEMLLVREAMERSTHSTVLRLEAGLGVVATALSGAPVLGLLGTVWGVMDSFGGLLDAGGAAGIQALAPGLSAAMLTTVAGLIVAIPSMFGYNFLVSRIRDQGARVEHFAAEFAAILDRHFVDHRGEQQADTSFLADLLPVGSAAFSGAPVNLVSQEA